MKTLIKTLAFTCLSLGAVNLSLAADDKPKTDRAAEKTDRAAEKAAEKAAELNHIALKDGKYWVMKDGETTELKEEVTLLDGTKVMADGSITLKDGEKKVLQEGEAITWDGKIQKHEKVMKAIEKHTEKAAKDAAKEEAKK